MLRRTLHAIAFGLELREHHRHDCELRLGVLDTGSKNRKQQKFTVRRSERAA